MKLVYELTRTDLFRAGTRSLYDNRILRLLAAPFLVYVVWTAWQNSATVDGSFAYRVTYATVELLIVTGTAACGGIVMTAAIAYLRKDKGVLGEHTLEITNDGLRESTDVNDSLNRWSSIWRIRQTKNYAYIYVTETNAHAVPLKWGSREGLSLDFINEVEARVKSAKGTPNKAL